MFSPCLYWFYYTKNLAFFQVNSKQFVHWKRALVWNSWHSYPPAFLQEIFFPFYIRQSIIYGIAFSLFPLSPPFLHPLLFNKSCPCLTKVQALPVRCFLGLFHKPIPAFTENFFTLPFVLPAKSPPQAWQTLRWKRRKENFITPIFYSYLSCSCVCSCSILPQNAIKSSLKSFFCGVWM